MTGRLPPTASVAEAIGGAKLHAPSAARNAPVLCDMLCKVAPATGSALEIASGTGQHVITFAQALPDIRWHPTDVDADRLRSIDAYVAETGLGNVARAMMLDATVPNWSETQASYDLVVLVNLLHLISTPRTRTLIREAARALTPKGTLVLYGPFARDGQLTSEGDVEFDSQLRATDPAIGYKDTRDMAHWLSHAGLDHTVIPMPANNLVYIARKPAQ